MAEFMVRDDLIEVRTFWKLRKFYDPLVKFMNEAGGYVFALQIEELCEDPDCKGIIKRMVEDKVVKTGKYKGQTFVYDTEATLKYIKYGDSPQDFEGVAKNLFSVSTLTGKPSEKQLLSSALKFGILADASRQVKQVKFFNKLVEGIGKTEYRESVEYLSSRYGSRTYPNFKMPGTSDYESYRKKTPQIINSLLGYYDCSKCALLPYIVKIEDQYKLNINFTIFDMGAEKSACDYVSMAYKAFSLFDSQAANIIKFIVYTYSDERKQIIMNDFSQYLETKWEPETHSQKVQGIDPVNYEDIIVDPILQKIMTKIKHASVKSNPN